MVLVAAGALASTHCTGLYKTREITVWIVDDDLRVFLLFLRLPPCFDNKKKKPFVTALP